MKTCLCLNSETGNEPLRPPTALDKREIYENEANPTEAALMNVLVYTVARVYKGNRQFTNSFMFSP